MLITDPYLDITENVHRLIKEYRKYGTLTIGFDFDNTIHDYHKTNAVYPEVIRLLQTCSEPSFNFTMCVYTCNPDIELVKSYCAEHGIRIDFINSSPIHASKPHKPFFSILLDDRAGLAAAYCTLVATINNIKSIPTEKESK